MLQSQAQPKWDSGFPHFGVGAGMKEKLAKDWQLQRIPLFITHMCHIINTRKALRVGSYVGEPSHCDNGEPVSGCALCQTIVTLKDCTDILSCEECFILSKARRY